MTKNYRFKNPYFRNARISEEETRNLVHYFVRGIKPAEAANFVGISEVATRNIYGKLRIAVTASGFHDKFRRLLEEDYYEISMLFQAVQGLLGNIDVNLDHAFKIEIEELTHHDPGFWADFFMQLGLGWGAAGATSDQLESCIRTCSTDTPPLVVQRLWNAGQLNEVVAKRASCLLCSLGVVKYSVPVRSRTTVSSARADRFTFERHYIYKEDVNEFLILWVEIIGWLADYRSVKKHQLRAYIMQGAVARLLKRAECKVRNIKFGETIDHIFLEPEQLEMLDDGYHYESTIDGPTVDAIMSHLEDAPI